MGIRCETVEDKVLTCHLYGRLRDINTGYACAVIGDRGIDGEAACIAETVEHTLATNVFLQGFAFISLVKKKACFLALPEIYVEKQTIFANGYFNRHDASGNNRPL